MSQNDDELLVKLTEAVLFLENRPVHVGAVAKITGRSREKVRDALKKLEQKLNTQKSALRVIRNERDDYYLTIEKDLYAKLGKYYDASKKIKLSPQALETLSIVAYKQPVTKSEIEKIRGVGVDYVLRILLEWEFVKVVGKKSVPGKPSLYGTTEKFLKYFGLLSLRDLPDLNAFERA